MDLFSGIGGFALAAHWAGFQTIGFAETDEYCSRILSGLFPGVINFGDVRNVPGVACDILTAGWPCQPFSHAGEKLGESDHRYLWPALLDAIKRTRPTWFIGENVTNIINMGLPGCLDELAQCGYQSKAFDIPSCAVGLPSMERHIWIVAEATGEQLERRTATRFQRQPETEQGGQFSAPILCGAEEWPDGWHLPEPGLLRSRKGVPHYVDRIKALGNAVPPPIAYQILKAINEIDAC